MAAIAAGVVQAHAAASLIVIGGGDGTLGTALHARRGMGIVGVLALGTRNHLARDLGIPTSLREAARLIAAGQRFGRSLPIDGPPSRPSLARALAQVGCHHPRSLGSNSKTAAPPNAPADGHDPQP